MRKQEQIEQSFRVQLEPDSSEIFEYGWIGSFGEKAELRRNVAIVGDWEKSTIVRPNR